MYEFLLIFLDGSIKFRVCLVADSVFGPKIGYRRKTIELCCHHIISDPAGKKDSLTMLSRCHNKQRKNKSSGASLLLHFG